jgi:hypothetical protein
MQLFVGKQALSDWMNTALSTLNTVDLGAVNGTSVELLLRNIISAGVLVPWIVVVTDRVQAIEHRTVCRNDSRLH